MAITTGFIVQSKVLKGHVNTYAILGLVLSIASILIANIMVSYQITGFISFEGVLRGQKTNPALWFLDLTPFMFAYWGQLFCYEVASSMETLIEDQTRELVNKSNDLELKLQFETHHDHLTNLPNARLYSTRINQGIKQIGKDEQLAVILLHINLFKDINRKYGNFNANSLLVQFAEKLKTILLEPYLLQAYMGMNMAARLQGAEFALLIPRLKKEHNLDNIIRQLIEATSTRFVIDGNNVKISITAGIAIYPLDGSDELSLLQHASVSLFHAEKEGLSFAIFEESMGNMSKVNQIKTKEIQTAIDDDNISMLYEPIIELKSKTIVGVEASPQYAQDESKIMSAEQIISLIEGTKLESQLTKQMLRKAIAQLTLWHNAGHKIHTLVTIYDSTDVELPLFIDELLKENHISSEYLKLALTEKVCLTDQTNSIDVLRKLNDLGIKIVISDFCSGYTSFIYLSVFPISEVKIDKSFIMNMLNDDKKFKIVEAAIKLAETMNIKLIADGVSDKNIIEKLDGLGCLYAEGPFFSKALPAMDMTTLLSK
jgi:diguanylate cyclase (GGDEF)-like protein